jgi:hypothetical protein
MSRPETHAVLEGELERVVTLAWWVEAMRRQKTLPESPLDFIPQQPKPVEQPKGGIIAKLKSFGGKRG